MGAQSLLLLPGMMLDRDLYRDQIRALARSAEVLVGDITRSDSIPAIARDVLRSAPSRFALAGVSMGGIVALEMWRQAAARITHLALLDTTPYADLPERTPLRMEQIATVESGGLREVLVDSMKPRYLAARNRHSEPLLKRILAMALALGPQVFRRQSLALRDRPDSTPTLPTIHCPALVLCGREDALCPVGFHETMAASIPRGELRVLPECGHLSTMEEPAAVTAALRQLLKRRA